MSDELIGSIVKRLEGITAELRELVGRPPSPPQPPAPPAPPVHSASLDVSEAAGKPGETVHIVLTGQSSYPAHGFACAIGYESLWLELLGVEWGEFVIGHVGDNQFAVVENRPREHPRVGNAGPHVVVSNFFIHPETGVARPLLFPPETILARLQFKIKETAPQRHKIGLLNRDRLFGKVRVFALIPPSEETPDLEDGWIQVLPA